MLFPVGWRDSLLHQHLILGLGGTAAVVLVLGLVDESHIVLGDSGNRAEGPAILAFQ